YPAGHNSSPERRARTGGALVHLPGGPPGPAAQKSRWRSPDVRANIEAGEVENARPPVQWPEADHPGAYTVQSQPLPVSQLDENLAESRAHSGEITRSPRTAQAIQERARRSGPAGPGGPEEKCVPHARASAPGLWPEFSAWDSG